MGKEGKRQAMPTKTNRQIHLISRPKGMPTLENFELHEADVPPLNEGEVLVHSLYLSVDPYMRGRIGGRPSSHPPFPINQPANGDGVGQVIASESADFKPGDTVCGYLEWADYTAAKGSTLRKINPKKTPPTTALSVLGMPAMTAYFGLLDIGKPQPQETVVVSGAAGAVGIMVGQIAKIHRCKVIGIVGSEAKANYLVQVS